MMNASVNELAPNFQAIKPSRKNPSAFDNNVNNAIINAHDDKFAILCAPFLHIFPKI